MYIKVFKLFYFIVTSQRDWIYKMVLESHRYYNLKTLLAVVKTYTVKTTSPRPGLANSKTRQIAECVMTES